MDVSTHVALGALSAPMSPAHYRLLRHKRETRRARANLHLLLAAMAGSLKFRGTDPIVTSLAANLRFAVHDLVIIRVTLLRQAVTLVIAPRRIWHSPERRQPLFVLKTDAGKLGRRVLLVAEPQLRKQPRLETAERILAARDAQVTTSQRVLVENFVDTAGQTTLAQCAAMLPNHDDPYGALLLMVGAGRLCIDLNRPITPESFVWSPLK